MATRRAWALPHRDPERRRLQCAWIFVRRVRSPARR
jgi:hypothetical protein